MATNVDAKMPQRPLTWGIELELVFAYHQTEIEMENSFILQKDIAYHVRARNVLWSMNATPANSPPLPYFTTVNLITHPNRVYNSWGANNGNPDPRYPINPYTIEPLKIMQKHLSTNTRGLIYDVRNNIPTEEKTKTFYTDRPGWIITTDPGVAGVGSQNIPKWLPDRVNDDVARNWDSYGIELNSPVFSTESNQGKHEITQIISALNSESEEVGAFITSQCGLHVHVQSPDNLEVLKSLAFLLIVYEKEIALMHPQCRRPYHPLGHHHECAQYTIESNRLGFVVDPDLDINQLHARNFLPSSHHRSNPEVSYGNVDVSVPAIAQKLSVRQISEVLAAATTRLHVARLFNWPSDDHLSIYDEDIYYGNRNRQVSFTRIQDENDTVHPSTIEFRQAKGSLDAEDITRWVDFCVGLVRLAYFYQANPEMFRVKHWLDEITAGGSVRRENMISVFDLMEDMDFDGHAVDYWKRRMGTFQCYTPGDHNDRCDDEKPPLGYVPPPLPPNSGGGGGSGNGSDDDDDDAGDAGGTDKRKRSDDDAIERARKKLRQEKQAPATNWLKRK
ncbi:hypothetical protein EG329_012014 [Mollisiaceae sp. DMI_Dod_QoI]|nr:hypothetical protein EG329_012014 [Helotiales sp. DMI_Dod_QoI]